MPAAPTCIQPSDVAGQLAQLQQNRSRPTAIIFLSGPSATQVPIETLRQHDVICVNGSIDYLLLNDVTPFIYLVTHHNFFLKKKQAFFTNAARAENLVVSRELYDRASAEEKQRLAGLDAVVIDRASKSKKGGIRRKLRLAWKYRGCHEVDYHAPWLKRQSIIGYSRDISHGYFHCRTVAYAALQLAESLGYQTAYLAGFDMNAAAGRFYESDNQPRLRTTLDQDYDVIVASLTFMKSVSQMKAYNMSLHTRIPYDVLPFARPATLLPEQRIADPAVTL